MRTKGLLKRILGSMMAFAVAFAMMPATYAHAASEYTVTFRPGNVGHFALALDQNKTTQEMAQEVADILYGSSATVTENGAIKVKVAAGAQMPAAPAYIIADTGYFVRSWGPTAGETVERNVDYVVDYGRLTDGVEYTVKYVDAESGDSIAPFLTAYANVGDSVSLNAPAVIITSNAGVYALTSVSTQDLVLAADANSNVVTFTYAYSYDPGTVITEIIRNIPGDTVTTTDTYTTIVDNGTPLAPAAAVVAGGQDDDAQDNPADNPDQELVNIEDEEVPLADISGEDGELTDEVVSIEDEEVPLAIPETTGGPNVMIIWAGALGAAAIALAIVWLRARKKTSQNEEQ